MAPAALAETTCSPCSESRQELEQMTGCVWLEVSSHICYVSGLLPPVAGLLVVAETFHVVARRMPQNPAFSQVDTRGQCRTGPAVGCACGLPDRAKSGPWHRNTQPFLRFGWLHTRPLEGHCPH